MKAASPPPFDPARRDGTVPDRGPRADANTPERPGNPLARELADIFGAIGAFAELVRIDLEDRPRARENLDHLVRACQRAHPLLNRLRHFGEALPDESIVQDRAGAEASVRAHPPGPTTSHGLVPEGIPLGRGERVLFVDDDPAQCRAALQLMHRLGYSPSVFNDPDAALEAFRDQPGLFDVAILDLSMPRVTGIDLATALLELRPGLPVYLATGVLGEWTPEMARNLGIRGVVMKPLSPVQWCLTLREALGEPDSVGTGLTQPMALSQPPAWPSPHDAPHPHPSRPR